MASGSPPVRRAFTLTELLIVIAIIAVLAGLLIPAANMVRQQANMVKCSSNMRQIAMAVEVYSQNANGSFPDNFPELVTLYALPPKVLLCPSDTSKGGDQYMGRVPPPPFANGWPDYSRLWYNHQNQFLPTPSPYAAVNTSYDFEASGTDNTNLCMGSWSSTSSSGDIGFFYRDLQFQTPTAADVPAGSVSWADCKEHEQKFGNVDASMNAGVAFPPGIVPILRCYHHWDWITSNLHDPSGASWPAKVNNISMEFNQIWSVPYWEPAFNPNVKVKYGN